MTRRLLAVAALVLALAIPASAGAAPREFFGTIAYDDPTETEFKRMGKGKVGTYRSNFYWPAVQGPGPLYFDWSRYDTLIGNAAENDIRVLLTIYGSPHWAADQPHHPPKPQFRDEFRQFVRAAVERYGPGGTFWTDHPELTPKPVKSWQVWNEVTFPQFWLPKPSARQYKPLLAAAANGIRAADPSAQIVLSGLFTRPNVKHGIPMVKFLDQLYRLKAKPLFDAVAVHPYAPNPDRVFKAVDSARQVMRRYKDGNTKLWITEVGWASSGIRSGLTVSPKKQANYLRQTYLRAARTRIRNRIAGVIWYTFRDLPPRRWIYRSGLLAQNGKAKPSWRAFVRLTGGQPS